MGEPGSGHPQRERESERIRFWQHCAGWLMAIHGHKTGSLLLHVQVSSRDAGDSDRGTEMNGRCGEWKCLM
ncbi:hypothetical protein PUN4_550176 [Paraburkholderia unamae]|nr:hypothetical protein PUN4_550176 [Paraburkholderia unamae]